METIESISSVSRFLYEVFSLPDAHSLYLTPRFLPTFMIERLCYIQSFEKESDPISESVIAVLSSIKDEKVKELLLNQIKLAAQMNF